jgi:lipopolysaccharide transport protein LptA
MTRKRFLKRILTCSSWLFLFGLVVWDVGADWEEGWASEAPGAENSAGSPIHITSDSVRSDQKARWVEFIGNVRAVQEGGIITSDSMKIFYKPGGDQSEKVATQAVEKMVAEGNVKIVFDNKTKTAMADQAVYTASDKVLILTGGNPTVESGRDVIRGKKITLFQAENRTLVEGDQKEQVEATFYSQGDGGLIK